jgi:excinuclease UvrABC helicase subunit UvrB
MGIYFSNFDDLFDDLFKSLGSVNYNSESFPKDNDPNFNKTIEEVDNGTHTIKNETWTSLDGNQFYKRTTILSKSIPSKNLKQLEFDLKEAIQKEEFEKAAQIRDEIKKLKN